MDDLLVKYQERLKKELGDEWSMYALDEERVAVAVKNLTILCEYWGDYSECKVNVMIIDLGKVTYSYTPKFTNQSVRTKAILAKLAGDFMFDYTSQPQLELNNYIFSNVKKINENLISFDVIYNKDTILQSIKWNGSSFKSLKNALFTEVLKNLGKDKEKYNESILVLCKGLTDSKYYCKLKGFAQKLLSEDK